MPIEQAIILPHGSNIVDPENYPDYPECQVLQDKVFEALKDISKNEFDLVFLITPHGHSLTKSHGIYQNKKAKGNIDDSDQYKNYTAYIDLEDNLSKLVLKDLEKKFNVEGILSYGSEMEQPIKWAEVIPIWFLNSVFSTQKTLPKFIIFSLSNRRYNEGDKMVNEMLEIGNELFDLFEKCKEKILLVVSTDLAHTHEITHGPEKGIQPYGITKEAEAFDKLCGLWAENPVKNEKLLCVEAANLLQKALSCGFLGMVVLNGILKKFKENVKSKVFANLHPTYFGMMVAIIYLK